MPSLRDLRDERFREIREGLHKYVAEHPDMTPEKAFGAYFYDSWREQFKGRFRPMTFEIKDSGERQQFESGMKRDTTTNKVQYDLVFDGPMLERFAEHLTKGARKYEPRNWMKANSEEEMARFKESAIRHFFQWVRGDEDEDHAAAVIFNLNGYEYVKEKLNVG